MAEDPAAAGAASRIDDYPATRRAWCSVAVLYAAWALVFFDRQVAAFLVEPIRADFAISDFQYSLLNGLLFVLFYSLLGIPLGRLADIGNRRNILAIGVGVLSVMTLLSGRATSYFALLLARVGVGAAQAALAPASVSLIADSFPADRRGAAINTYAAGMYGGIGLANVFGGAIVAAAATLTGLSVPLIGAIAPWQLAFVAIAVPGFIVLGLLLALQEPGRRTRTDKVSPVQNLRATIEFVRADWFVFTSLIVGAGLSGVGLFGMYAWVPALFTRVFGWSSGPIGLVFGLLTIVLGTAGLFLSGSYAGEFIRRGADIVYQRLMMLAVACAIVPGAIIMTADSALAMWACIGAVIFFLGMPFGLAQAAIVAITPNRMRGQLIAAFLLVFSFLGLGLGPAVVAGVTDFVFADDALVNRSIGFVIVASGVASVLLLALGVKQYEEMGRRKNE